MGIFIGQLVGFAVIVFVIWKWVVPPVRKMMANQQETVRRQMAESEEASQRLDEAKQAHAKAVSNAREESAKIREEALADAEQIKVQLREHADAEVSRIKQQGGDHVTLLREQLIRRLRADLGGSAVQGAEEKVRDHLAQPGARSASVDRFLGELEGMAESATAPSRTKGVS